VSNRVLTIGSRGSALARWQADYVARRLQEIGIESRIQIIKTTGDHLQTASLTKDGGKGLFTKEIEDALLAGSIDLAVHSLKDLPTQSPAGLAIAAIPEREDPRDALVGSKLASLPKDANVGTSSLRRAAQLLALRPDVRITSIRGNVDTRVRKQKEGQYDAIVLAAAGLRRLGLEAEIAEMLSPEQVCCAPGQGALAIQTRDSDDVLDLCARLNHVPSERAVTCERALLEAVGGGCQLPVGAYATASGDELAIIAVVASPGGETIVRGQSAGSVHEAERVGESLARELISRGAEKILQSVSAARL
jgi:hydroxymethylbilane synthase